MVFAAGKGVRMMPLTAHTPKPMLEVAGQPLLGHMLDRFAQAGVENVVVNAHHLPDIIAGYLPRRTTPKNLILSREQELLETGGGVRFALEHNRLSTREPFYGANADILWTDGATPALNRLAQEWQRLGDAVDVLLLLVPMDKAWGLDSGKGDYAMNAQGQLTRLSNPQAPYVYGGVQITRPALYDGYAAGARFSNLEIFDAAQAKGRLYGLVHDGNWYHFSTPESLPRFAALTP
jgi:MurNAc alpha-1-phosphate uridylyltransferase